MLELRRIVKTYGTGAAGVEALRGIDVRFRPSEFAAILGPSGCGKTTLLNIIGGLDRYTRGQLFIGGRPTDVFTEKDWDAHRNHSVGFVFQSFNLIPHQTALANVALALTLSGVPRRERDRRAARMLQRVGLGDQLHKLPNEMSGGQMQRVAIARALINDPDILLADEPTGSLDSETSRQVLNILKRVAEDRLVIMVTHNADFAREYATRIVSLQDGLIVDDSDPYDPAGGRDRGGKYSGRAARFVGAEAAGGHKRDRGAEAAEGHKRDREAEAAEGGVRDQGAGAVGRGRPPLRAPYRRRPEDGAAGEFSRRAPRRGTYPSMSFSTALSLSLNNLKTKAVRAAITAFAGSIGITGIGLIIALSAGMQHYISDPQADILRSFPIVLEEEVFDGGPEAAFGGRSRDAAAAAGGSGSRGSGAGDAAGGRGGGNGGGNGGAPEQGDNEGGNRPAGPGDPARPAGGVYLDRRFSDSLATAAAGMHTNDLAAFKAYMEEHSDEINRHASAVSYEYDVKFTVYTDTVHTGGHGEDAGGSPFLQVYPGTMLDRVRAALPGGSGGSFGGSGIPGAGAPGLSAGRFARHTWRELVGSREFLAGEYDLVAGRWPETPFDMVLVIDGENRIPEMAAYDLGLAAPPEGFPEHLMTDGGDGGISVDGADGTAGGRIITYEEIFRRRYRIIPRAYSLRPLRGDGSEGIRWADGTHDAGFVEMMLADAADAAVTAVVKPAEGSDLALPPGSMGYTPEFTRHIMAATRDAPVVQAQTEEPSLNVLTGRPFDPSSAGGSAARGGSAATYEQVMAELGVVNEAAPKSISIYTEDFRGRDGVADFIAQYNELHGGAGESGSEKTIVFTDLADFLGPFSTLINGITYVLIAFVAVSLVVSSIMIGIVSYISVLERTKEIGVLRSLGASRGDIGRVFNAETIIVGFAAGALGVLAAVVLSVPGSLIIEHFADIPGMVRLPAGAGAILIAASMGLTFLAGLIPAGIAARQNPVEALRAE